MVALTSTVESTYNNPNFHPCESKAIFCSHTSALAQGNVAKAKADSYGKSKNSALCSNQTISQIVTKIGIISNVDNFTKRANLHRSWFIRSFNVINVL